MNTDREHQISQIVAWAEVLGMQNHRGDCRFRVGEITYDLSAADPTKWEEIRARGLFVVEPTP